MKYLILISLAALAIIIFLSSKQRQLPTKRSEMSSTIMDGKIYIAGGINLRGSSKSFEVYDIKLQKWRKLADLPEKLNHTGLTAYQNKIYLSGGNFNMRQSKFSDVLYVYDIIKNKWSELKKMPEKRAAHVMILRKNHLHLIGGRNHNKILSLNLNNLKWEYDLISPLPEKRDHLNILQNDENLYLVGGRRFGKVKANCWIYNFNSKEWKLFTQLPAPRGGQSACFFEGKIHVIGGEDLESGITYSRHDIYDIQMKEWTQGDKLTIARHGFISERLQNKWYFFGGGKKAGIKTLYSTTANMEILNLE